MHTYILSVRFKRRSSLNEERVLETADCQHKVIFRGHYCLSVLFLDDDLGVSAIETVDGFQDIFVEDPCLTAVS